jgi:hypothetical protein
LSRSRICRADLLSDRETPQRDHVGVAHHRGAVQPLHLEKPPRLLLPDRTREDKFGKDP